MHLRRLIPFVTALTISLGACSGDGPQIELSDAEISQLFEELFAMFDEFEIPFAHSSGMVPMFAVAGTPPISETAPCPEDGSMSFSGNYTETDTELDFDVTNSFNSCKTENFTVGGSLRWRGNIQETQTTFSASMTIKGTLSVSHVDGRTGNCTWDVSFSMSGFNFSQSGKVCGRPVDAVI